jgi:hypothetical protein
MSLIGAAAAAGPTVDGTPTKGSLGSSSTATSYPAGFGAGNVGDCCILLYCGVNAITGNNCSPAWTTTGINNSQWNAVTETAYLFTHVYANGDTAPTCSTATANSGSWNLRCYKNSKGCTFASGPTGNKDADNITTQIIGPGITGTAGDAHLFDGCVAGSRTFSTYNDSLTQEVTQANTTASSMGADVTIASGGAQPTARATISVTARHFGIEADLEGVPATPTISSATANSPNSIKFVVQTTGVNSIQIGCSPSPSHSHSIVTKWLPSAGGGTSISTTIYAAQLEPSTGYFCVAIANAGNDGGAGSATSAETSLVTTNAAQTAIAMTANARTGPVGSADYTTGANAKTESLNYDNCVVNTCTANANDGGDGRFTDMLANGSTISTIDDGSNGTNGGSANFQFETLTFDANGIVNGATLVNQMTGYGASSQLNFPLCWSDGFDFKSTIVFAEGSHLFTIPWRWTPASPFTTGFSTVIRSDDNGATWFNPNDTTGVANGDAPCPTPTPGIMWPATGNAYGSAITRVEDPTGKAGAVTNPQDGLDAYEYVVWASDAALNTNLDYLSRIHKGLAGGYSGTAYTGYQDVTKWEYWTNAASDNDINNPANWASFTSAGGSTSPASIFNEHGFCVPSEFRPAWIPDAKRYVATTFACGILVILSSTNLVSNSWTTLYAEASTPPFSGSPWNISGGMFRNWISFASGSYKVVNASNPLVVSVNAYHGAYAGQFNSSNRQLNPYSAMSLIVNLAQPESVSGSFGNGGTVTASRAVSASRSGSFGNGGTTTGLRAVQIARADTIGNGGTITASRTAKVARSSSIGNGGTVAAARSASVARNASFGNSGTFSAVRGVSVARAASFGNGGIIAAGRAVVAYFSGLIHAAGTILGLITTIAPTHITAPPFVVSLSMTGGMLEAAPLVANASVRLGMAGTFTPTASMHFN